MPMNARVREFASTLTLVAVCTGVGTVVGYARNGRPAPAVLTPPEVQVYSAVPLGEESGTTTPVSSWGLGPPTAVVVALRASDIDSCEDLGRQLRELARHMHPRATLVISVLESESSLIARFVRIERIPAARISVTKQPMTSRTGEPLSTPAALVFDGSGRLLAGVGHSTVVVGARVKSFAYELSEALAAQGVPLGEATP
jgi:hypothetical protein